MLSISDSNEVLNEYKVLIIYVPNAANVDGELDN
jgi:hypothetical protein